MKNHMRIRLATSVFTRALSALFLIGLVTPQLNSQTTPSLSLRLNVVDTQGLKVPGAKVVLNSVGTDQEVAGVTTDNGTITFTDLQPGMNKVTVKATGFATLEQSLTVGVNRRNDLTLAIEPLPVGTPIISDEERTARERGEAPAVGPYQNDNCGSDITCKVKLLRLGLTGRFARGFQYEYKLIEQPGTVLISSGKDAGLVTAFVRNPENVLQAHTISFKFAELFPDRLSLFKRGSDYLNKYPSQYSANGYSELSEVLCKKRPLVTCLTKGGSWWQRFLMGTSINISFSERAAILQGFFVTDPRFGKKYQVNGGFSFDPAKLFPNASNWRSTFEDLQKIDKAVALLGVSDAYPHGTPWKVSFLAALLPKVEFKILSQFDFVKDNGVLVEAPFPEHALNTWTFTWDLTRIIPDTKNRIDADAIRDGLNNLGKEPTLPKITCTLHFSSGGDRKFEVKPGFTEAMCIKLKNELHAISHDYAVKLKGK